MAANANIITVNDINVTPRAADFVSSFGDNWNALREIMNFMQPIKKYPGTNLKSKTANVELQSGDVAEGDLIPRSKVTVEETPYEEIKIKKYAKEVSLEAIDEHGYDAAVAMTDEAFKNELQGNVMTKFYDFLGTGSLTDEATTFQMAVALAVGKVRDKFKKIHKTANGVVVFVNTLDAYRYLGAAQLTVQSSFGIDYIKNFMGADTVILSSEIAEGKVIATATNNIVLYYVDPGDSEYARAGLVYTVEGETNLIGFATQGDYDRATSVSYAIMGLTLMAEYIDGVAVISVTDAV